LQQAGKIGLSMFYHLIALKKSKKLSVVDWCILFKKTSVA
jgi:hypothetical protein